MERRLLVGNPARKFRQEYKGKVSVVHSRKELASLIANLDGIQRLQYPLVIDDISSVGKVGVPLLLKLLEDSAYDIILLSSIDTISPVLLSRIAQIEKAVDTVKPYYGKPTTAISRLHEATESLDEVSVRDKTKIIIESCPLYYMLSNQIKVRRNRDKVFSILTSESSNEY